MNKFSIKPKLFEYPQYIWAVFGYFVLPVPKSGPKCPSPIYQTLQACYSLCRSSLTLLCPEAKISQSDNIFIGLEMSMVRFRNVPLLKRISVS
jgi:hypothetical protein